MLSPQAIQADQQTPPLWQTFNPAGLATRLALPWWWLAVELLGLLAFPLAFMALPGLRDRGWGLAKAMGVLLLSVLIWLPASLGVLPYERGTVWLAFVALAAIGGGIFWRRRREIVAFVRKEWRIILLTEIVTLAAFLFFVFVRSLDPDLWHIYRGGEKPMELAFLDGILRSRTLPPLDPWFAGGAINYYYFGQFLIATLIQLTGIVPETAFNLAIPMLFALTIAGAISVVGGISRRWWVGVVGGWALAVAGNLDGLGQFWVQFQQYLAHTPISIFDYWASSRVIPYTINEFPYWSFLYADLHAHVIDLPIVLLGLGAAASVLGQSARSPAGIGWRQGWTIAVAALALGAMACINTWDAPAYGLVIVAALLIAEWRQMQSEIQASGDTRASAWWQLVTWVRLRRVGATIVILGAGAIGIYLPFYLNFQSFVTSTGPVTTPTDPLLFLRLFGLWIFVIVTFLIMELHDRIGLGVARRNLANLAQWQSETPQRLVIIGVVATLALTLVILGGVKVLLLALLGLGIFLALDGRHGPAKQFTYLVILAGAGIALLVEFVYLRDFLDGSQWERMNTVFKFYYQVWLLFALGAALAGRQILSRVFGWRAVLASAQVAAAPDLAASEIPLRFAMITSEEDPLPSITRRSVIAWPLAAAQDATGQMVLMWLRGAWIAVLIVLVFGASVFLYEGTAIRVQDRTNWGPLTPVNPLPSVPSLDGFAYMQSWYPGDAAAITWINEHISGAPVILEASSDPYEWYGRVSIYTGLPSVLGWGSHESQQRYPDEVYARQPDVETMYGSGDPATVLAMLQRYHVQYVYVGQLECLTYGVHDPQPMGRRSPACNNAPPRTT